MTYKTKKIVEDTYSITFNNFDISLLSNADCMDKEEVHFYISQICAELSLNITDISVWNTTENSTLNEIPYTWHEDAAWNTDTLLLIYFTDDILNSDTGGRIGFKDTEKEVFLDVSSGLCFIQHQVEDKILHTVEPFKKNVSKRLVISCCLSGWEKFNPNQ
jgi:hypothetical protein